MRSYRRGAVFVLDPARHSTVLDRNARARLLHTAEILERATKAHGCRNGLISAPGLVVLRTLLLRFQNGATGLCCPSYAAIQKATGLCRQTIATAITKLEAVGILKVTRRLVRFVNAIGVSQCGQGSNLYAFKEPPARLDLGKVGLPFKTRRFPARVHEIGGNYKTPVREKLRWTKEVGFQPGGDEPVRPQAVDWRERARQALCR